MLGYDEISSLVFLELLLKTHIGPMDKILYTFSSWELDINLMGSST